MERCSPIFESIGTNRKIHSLDRQHSKSVVALHHPTAGRKTNIRPMNFDESGRRAAGEPLEEKHQPLMAIGAVPASAAAFIVIKQRDGLGTNLHSFVIVLGAWPFHRPVLVSKRLVRPVPKLNRAFSQNYPRGQKRERRSVELNSAYSWRRLRQIDRRIGVPEHKQTNHPQAQQTDDQNGEARRVMPFFDAAEALVSSDPD